MLRKNDGGGDLFDLNRGPHTFFVLAVEDFAVCFKLGFGISIWDSEPSGCLTEPE